MKNRQTGLGHAAPAKRRGLSSRLMEACRGPYALPAFFGVSALESAGLPLPIDMAMVPLGLAMPRRLPMIVLVGTLGSILGAVLGYVAGAFFMATLGQWLLGFYGVETEASLYLDFYGAEGWKAVVAAGITPLPFMVATVLSGAAGMSFPVFLGAAFGIRLLRFALMGLMIRIFGAAIAKIMTANSRSFAVVMIIATILGALLLPMILMT